MKRKATFAALCALAVIIIGAATVQGTAQFTGPRWNPQFAPPSLPPRPLPSDQVPTGSPTPATPKTHSTLFIPPGLIIGILVVIAALIAAALLWRWVRSRPTRFTATVHVAGPVRPATATAIEDEPDSEALAPVVRRGLARAIEILEEERLASDAIVAAWLGLQEAAEDSGVHRRASETPAEFTTRIIRKAGAGQRSAGTLLRLYQNVRFGGIAATDDDVAQARAALTELSAAWHPSTVPPADPTRSGGGLA